MRPLAFALLVATAGCSAPDTPPPATPEEDLAPPAAQATDDRESRGAEAGLSPAQSAQIASYGFGAVVPQLPPGWTLAGYRNETVVEAVTYPGYWLQYADGAGRCFELLAASEGLGDVFVIEPPNIEEADAPRISLFGPVPIGWSGPDEAGDWGPSQLSTEWFGTDGLFMKLSSATEDRCTAISAQTARELLASLRYLDPADDAAPAGYWEIADVPASDAPAAIEDPEADALSEYGSAGEEGTTSTVTTLREGPHAHVVLVTSEGLADDSIRDRRTRVSYFRGMDGGWMPQYAGRQQRCREGRGHQDWSSEACV